MKRAASIIIGIFLGALAASIGVGIFLKLANDDRNRLAASLNATIEQAKTTHDDSQRAVDEANQKLASANAEVAKAQHLVKALQEERDIMAVATPLTPPSTQTTRDWKEGVSVPFGVAIKYPADSAVETNDNQAFTLARSRVTDDGRWLSVLPYDERLERDLLASLSTSTAVSYIVNGRLLTGYKGTIANHPGSILVLRVRSAGQITHLLWMREGGGFYLLGTTILGSLRFSS